MQRLQALQRSLFSSCSCSTTNSMMLRVNRIASLLLLLDQPILTRAFTTSATRSSLFLTQQPSRGGRAYCRYLSASSSSDTDADGGRSMPLNATMVIRAHQRIESNDESNRINGLARKKKKNDDDDDHDAPTASSTGSIPRPQSISSAVLAIDPSEIQIVTLEDAVDDSHINGQSRTAPAPAEQTSPKASTSTTRTTRALPSYIPFVGMFRGSANYIANHRNTLAVYHIPGSILTEDDNDSNNSEAFRNLMNDISLTWLLGMKVVLVVGCRHQIERRLLRDKQLEHHTTGSSSQQHDWAGSLHDGALRVTDEDTLRIVKEEAGYVRFEVERQLARSLRIQGGGSGGGEKLGSNGGEHFGSDFDGNVVSGNFYSAQPFGVRDGVDYKFTGFVRRVEAQKIRQVLDGRDICLLTTLGVSPSGEVFNCNSESLAAAVAGALGASKVIYFTDKETELRHTSSGNKIQSLRLSDARKLLKRSDISVHKKGYVTMGPDASMHDKYSVQMLLKIGYSMQALEQGVKRAHIISPKHGALLQELYTRDGSGTLISGDLYEGIRRANVNDVAGIHDLIAPLIQMGTLVDRPRATLEKDVDMYYVYTRDNHIVACGQLKQFEDGFAEIGCLVVNKDYRSRGRGDAMLGYLERLSVENGCTSIFVLSTQTMEWFVERGFEEVEVDRLPPSRKVTYNHSRNSKIYMKKIESLRDLDAQELWWNR